MWVGSVVLAEHRNQCLLVEFKRNVLVPANDSNWSKQTVIQMLLLKTKALIVRFMTLIILRINKTF